MKNVLSQEQVIKGQLEIAKSGHSGESGVVPGLEGIEFTMKLKSEVNAEWHGIKPRLTV